MITSLAHAWRSWTRSPGVTLLAILTFAIGLGSATAIFTVISGVMLRPVPYPDGDRYTVLFGARTNEPGSYMTSSVADLTEYQQRTTSFDLFGWFRSTNFNLIVAGEPQYVPGAMVTPALARGLGVEPMLGRWFDDENSAVLSHRLWTRLGADPGIVGTAVTLDERRVTVSGVMPLTFRLPVAGLGSVPAEIWTALPPVATDQLAGLGVHVAYARRKPGVSLSQAQADAVRVATQLAQSDPTGHALYTAALVALRQDVFGELRAVLLTLLVAAAVLVLIACANVATLLLARSVARARETAIHVALGVSRRQLALRYFVEAAGLSLAGAAGGIVLSITLVGVIATAGSEYLPPAEDIPIDWRVLLFGGAITGVASALASLAPLWQATRIAPNAVLTGGIRATAGAGVRRLSHGLVVAEIALAFVLLTVASILVAHLQGLGRVAPGFEPDNLLAFEVTIPQRINQGDGRVPYVQRLTDALRAMPDATAVSFSNQLPLDGCCVGGTVLAEGSPSAPDTRRVSFMFVSPEYLDTMRIPLRAGRFLRAADQEMRSDTVLPVVVNEAAARRYWPNRDPIGASGRLNQTQGRFEVVGVAGDVRNDGLNDDAEAELYLPWSIFPANPLHMLVRSPLPPERLVPLVRQAIRTVDATVAVHDVQPMRTVVQASLQLERISSLMMVFFAVAAVIMATLGVYGVVAYAVRQRTVEMGTRLALGAIGRDLLMLIVGGGLRMAAAGILIGGVSLVAAVWALIEFLEVRESGWAPFTLSTLLVGMVTAAASFAPAWRASRLSPIVAIRDERSSAWHAAGRRLRQGLADARQLVSSADTDNTLSPTTALLEFVDAARDATSYGEALQQVLAALCAKLGVESGVLMERSADGVFRRRVAVGDMAATIPTLPGDGFLARRLGAYRLPLPFVAGELETLAEWALAQRPDRTGETRALAQAAVGIAVPLRTRGGIMGILLLGRRRTQYTGGEMQVLRTCADQFALMLENGRLTERVVEHEAVRRDLALAVEVQKRLFPAEPPAERFAEFAAVSIPARGIGGDYYDFIRTGPQQVGIAIADVSGKGIAAALIMSVVQASLRIVTSDAGVPLPRLTAMLNTFLYRSTPASKYATFFYAAVDGASRQLRYVNAGHNPPYLVRAPRAVGAGSIRAGRAGGDVRLEPDTQHLAAGGTVAAGPRVEIEELSTGGMVVGMFPEAEYEEDVADLFPGDVLVAFTDGVPEAHNPAGEEFGDERLKELARATVDLPAAEITSRIAAALKDWIQDAEQYDDMTVVVMKVSAL